MPATDQQNQRRSTAVRLTIAATTAVATAALLALLRDQVAGFVQLVGSALAVLLYIAGSVPGRVYWTLAVGISIALALRLLLQALNATRQQEFRKHGSSDPSVDSAPPYPPLHDSHHKQKPRISYSTPVAERARYFEDSIDASRYGSPLGGRIDRRVAEIVAHMYGYTQWNRDTGETIASRPEIMARPSLRAAIRGETAAGSHTPEHRPDSWYARVLTPRQTAREREKRARKEEHRLQTLISELETLENL